MFNRIIILALLAFSSAAIPMQNQPNYQTRSVQNVNFESCKDIQEKVQVTDDIITKVQLELRAFTNCSN